MAEKDLMHSTALSSDSKERWARHAIIKLSKGYKLVMSRTRKVANFHKGFGDYETCPYRTAARLIKEGFVVEVGEQPMGVVFELKDEFRDPGTLKKKLVPKVAPKMIDDDDDDLDDDDLDDDDLDDEDLDDDILDDDLDDDTEDLEDDLLAEIDD